MTTYKGRVALVTGASAGIGAAIAEALVKEGLIVVGAARRVELIEDLAESLKDEPGRLVPRKLDVSDEKDIEETFSWIESELGGVDVLVNNAAVLISKPINELSIEEIKLSTDVNILGVIYASREAVNGMIRRNVNNGYIINMNSLAGHAVPYVSGLSLGIYPTTKFGLTAMCQQLRHDVKQAGLNVRVTSISPGVVGTEMAKSLQGGAAVISSVLTPAEVAKTVTFILSLPVTVEITEMTVRPTNEAY